jgi:hypothetical protein
MKRIVYPLWALGLCLASFLPAQTFQWAKSMGGSQDEKGYNVAFDSQGNVYAVGQFSGTADFDPGAGTFNLTSLGATDIFVVKLNAIGGLIWAKQMGGSSNDYAHGLAVDASGNVHVTGYFYSLADFDPGPGTVAFTAAASADAYVVKLDSNGNLVWAKQFAGNDSDKGMAITVDGSGNVYTTGNFIYTCDFDPGPATANLTANGTIHDAFISKLDVNGNYVWAKRLGGAWSDYGYAIALTSNSELIIVGEFEGTADFDPGTGTYNLTTSGFNPDAFICRLSAAGALVWAKGVGDSGFDRGRTLALDASDNIYCGGTFGFTVDFDPGAGTSNLTANGSYDGFILKLNSSGNFVWAKAIGGSGTGEGVRGFSLVPSGLFYTGEFTGTVDFNPNGGTNNLTAVGTQDAYVAKLDLSGNYVSAFGIGGAGGYAIGTAIMASSSGTVYTSGYYQASVDFDPGAGVTSYTSAGLGDVWIQKLSVCTNTASSLTASACSSYTFASQTYTTSGVYTATIPNSAGCDSVITLNLTIRQPSSNTLNQTVCDTSFTFNSQTYTSSGTYVQTLTNSVGCDSTLTLNLILNQPTSATLNETTCAASYTLNSQTYTSSGTYTQTLTNAAGCDSTLTLNLTLNQPTSASLTEAACESYTLNAQTYTASGTYTQTLTNAAGCDSTLTLILTITTAPNATITPVTGSLEASPGGLTYQWLDCDNGLQPIPGATGQTFTPTNSGNYAVIVADGPCADTSACASFSVSIRDGNPNAISLHPNPAQDDIMIDLGYARAGVTVEVVDLLGQTLIHQYCAHGTVIPLKLHVAAGMYWVRVHAAGETSVLRLVKR